MTSLIINGGKKLSGEVNISGAKNAALPLLAAAILTDEKVIFENVPALSDVYTMFDLLRHLGCEIDIEEPKQNQESYGFKVTIQAKNISSTTAPYEIVKKMRASFLVLGGLLAREKEAIISLPGGCAIGARPIDYHLNGFEKMGAEINLDGGYVTTSTPKGNNGKQKKLEGAIINLPFPSVGATENLIIAATLANGKTTLNNAAKEPEIIDLANMLNKMGAKIKNAGSNSIEIIGVDRLHGTKHKIISDRIEAASFLIAGVMTQGEVTVNNVSSDIFGEVLDYLERTGACVQINDEQQKITASYCGELKPVFISTDFFPGFATDMQAQFCSLLSLAKGKSSITENIFENRFMHVPELVRMGADITLSNKTATINGIERFSAAEVMATDLRASMCLVLAALNAKGKSIVNRLYHLDRGYEKIENKLQKLGADVYRDYN